jgi:hypothetical protein
VPNWITNELTVTGSKDDMAAFYKAAAGHSRDYVCMQDTDWESFTDIRLEAAIASLESMEPTKKSHFSFHALIPVPDAVLLMPYDPGQFERLVNSNKIYADFCKKHNVTCSGYDWERENWGVIWGDCHTDIHTREDETFVVHFDTAWAAPDTFVEKISALFPRLAFSLHSADCSSRTYWTISFVNGEEIESSSGPYDDHEEELSD